MAKRKTLGEGWADHADPVAAVRAWMELPARKRDAIRIGNRVSLRMPNGAIKVVPLSVFAQVSVGDLDET